MGKTKTFLETIGECLRSGFGRLHRKMTSLALRDFSWNPYLKTDGGSHLIIFSVKDPKQQSLFKNQVEVSNLEVANTY